MILKYKCEICKNEYNSIQSLSNHISRGHKLKIQEYYDKFLLKANENKCLECGNKTTFINYRLGYHKFCSLKCVENNEEIKNRILKTNEHLHGGIGFASEELRNKTLKTYNDKNNTDIKIFGLVAWNEESRNKRNKTISENGKLSNAVSEIWKCRTEEDIKTITNKTKQTKRQRFGDENYNNIQQSIETKIKKYKRLEGFNKKKHIKYDSFVFDSTLELEFYKEIKKLKDLNIVKSDIFFDYEFDNKIYKYNPDFLITYNDNQYIVETKGLHFYKDHNKNERMINPYVKQDNPNKQYEDDLVESKHQCMIKNNVYTITSTDEINDFLNYINYSH